MARLMRLGCEESASFSADGRGLSLNFYTKLLLTATSEVVRGAIYFVERLAILVKAGIYGL